MKNPYALVVQLLCELVVGDVVAGVFLDIDLNQITGCFQQLSTFR